MAFSLPIVVASMKQARRKSCTILELAFHLLASQASLANPVQLRLGRLLGICRYLLKLPGGFHDEAG